MAKKLSLIYFLIVGTFALLLLFLFPCANVYETYFRIRQNILYHSLKIAFNLVLIDFFVLTIYFLSLLSLRFPNRYFTGTGIEVIKWPLPLDKNITYEKALVAFATITVIFLLWIFKSKIEYILKKKFYQSEINYRKTATELSEIIAKNIQLLELAKNVLKELENLNYLKSAGLIISQNEKKVCCSEFFGINRKIFQPIDELFTKELIKFLKNRKERISIGEIKQAIFDETALTEIKFFLPVNYK